jgi:hypothetical protein
MLQFRDQTKHQSRDLHVIVLALYLSDAADALCQSFRTAHRKHSLPTADAARQVAYLVRDAQIIRPVREGYAAHVTRPQTQDHASLDLDGLVVDMEKTALRVNALDLKRFGTAGSKGPSGTGGILAVKITGDTTDAV